MMAVAIGLRSRKREGVLLPDAEKSMLLRWATPDVQILWKKVFWNYVPFQFPYVIKFVKEVY